MGGGIAPGSTSSYPKLAARPVGQLIENIYTDRIKQFTDGGQYQGQNLCAYVAPSLPMLQLCS